MGIFTHLESCSYRGTCWPLGDKLPSDHSSKTDVRGQCDNSSTGKRLAAGAAEVQEMFNPLQNLIIYSTSPKKKEKKKRKKKSFCCLLRSPSRGSLLVHMVCTGCSKRAAVTVSRVEQMSPLKAFFSYTHGLYYHHEIKLKTCPFRHHNDRVILGR